MSPTPPRRGTPRAFRTAVLAVALLIAPAAQAVPLSLFSGEYGRTDCSPATPCASDLDADRVVDGRDLARRGFRTGFAYLQHRTYADPAADGPRGWAALTEDGGPIEPDDVVSVTLRDPAGRAVPGTTGFWGGRYLWYDCRSGACSWSGPHAETGFWTRFHAPLIGGTTYTYDLLTTEGPLTRALYYPRQVALPVVDAATMTHAWWPGAGAGLLLSWQDPTDAPAWGEVTELRVVLSDAEGREILYAAAPPGARWLLLPADLVLRLAPLGDPSALSWQVQTRAYDRNGMNFARGVSNRKPLGPLVPPLISLTAENAERVAAKFFFDADIFSDLGPAVLELLGQAMLGGPPCESGRAVVTHDDAPPEGLSPGDRVAIRFQNCVEWGEEREEWERTDGRITFDILALTGDPTAGSLETLLTFEQLESDSPGDPTPWTVEGRCRLALSGAGDVMEWTVTGDALYMGDGDEANLLTGFSGSASGNRATGAFSLEARGAMASDHLGGAFTFDTPTPFSGTGELPTAGEIRFGGALGSAVTAEALMTGVHVRLEVDADGDGAPDGVPILTTWEDLDALDE
ncbi:MAG: hypothetical protein Kow0092_31520 [Deferrisomatales bacterium]